MENKLSKRLSKKGEIIDKNGLYHIYGGKIAFEEMKELIANNLLFNDMEYAIIETPVKVAILPFTREIINKSQDILINKCRFFGEKGDLTFERQENGYRWNYIGRATINNNQKEWGLVKDFWEHNNDVILKLYKENEPILLWDAKDGRVARANLSSQYQKLDFKGKQPKLNYWMLTDNQGSLQFVWYKGII